MWFEWVISGCGSARLHGPCAHISQNSCLPLAPLHCWFSVPIFLGQFAQDWHYAFRNLNGQTRCIWYKDKSWAKDCQNPLCSESIFSPILIGFCASMSLCHSLVSCVFIGPSRASICTHEDIISTLLVSVISFSDASHGEGEEKAPPIKQKQ